MFSFEAETGVKLDIIIIIKKDERRITGEQLITSKKVRDIGVHVLAVSKIQAL